MKQILLPLLLSIMIFSTVALADDVTVNAGVSQNLTNCNTIIEAGTYYLLNDITNSGFKTCMNISVNDVTLDCQNYKIDGIDSSFPANITYGIYFADKDNVVIKNCYVSDWGFGITATSLDVGAVVDNATITSNAIGILIFGTNITLSNSDITSNTAGGAWIGYSSAPYPYGCTNCNIFNNYFYGTPTMYRNQTGTNFYDNNLAFGGLVIHSALANAFGGNIYDNNITYNGGWGIYFYNYNNTVGNNFNITDWTIYGNRIVVTTYGIMTSGTTTGGKVFNNKIYDNYINSTLAPVQDTNGFFLSNEWNTTSTLATNIIGGIYKGGNYYGKTAGDGYSDTCKILGNGNFCMDAYTVIGTQIDYLPLTFSYLGITFNFSAVVFGALDVNTIDNPAPDQATGVYNVSVDTNQNYKVNVSATDFSGGGSLPLSNLKLDVQNDAGSLSNTTATALQNSAQLIASLLKTDTLSFFGYFFSIPAGTQAGSYSSTNTITYYTA